MNYSVARVVFGCLLAFCFLPGSAKASPWAEVGDPQLRSDIEVLADAGVIDDITTQWPVPWDGILTRLHDSAALNGQPGYVREAARRVLGYAQSQMQFDQVRAQATLDMTNTPNVVRGFDGMGLGQFQGQLSAEYMTDSTAVRLSAGALISKLSGGKTDVMMDGSYVAQQVGGAVVYAGYLSHWWGPGWISALSLSNNARPFPQLGIARLGTSAFDTPWLSWIGPWQAEFIVGWLNDTRIATNTLWDGLRVTFNPLPGLQIGLARTDELCGEGHPCKPLTTYFDLRNDYTHASQTNDEGVVDFRYTNMVRGVPFEVYMQIMNEDSNPISHSDTSHLFGASAWIPADENSVRLTVEYTDSIATNNVFSFGNFSYGVTYNDYKYPGDGMRYNRRALGFSLDSDSRLLSVQAATTDSDDRTYTLTYHRAQISTPFTGAANPLTAAPVTVDLGEARVTFPFRSLKFDIAARVQDDQPRPARGATGAIEVGMTLNL